MIKSFDDLLINACMAKIYHRRAQSTNYAEVVFYQNKTPDQVAEIMVCLVEHEPRDLTTLASVGYTADAASLTVDYGSVPRLLPHIHNHVALHGNVLVLSAGTADLPVAEEASRIDAFLGSLVVRHFECGVAGIYQFLPALNQFRNAMAVVCVADLKETLAVLRLLGEAETRIHGVPIDKVYSHKGRCPSWGKDIPVDRVFELLFAESAPKTFLPSAMTGNFLVSRQRFLTRTPGFYRQDLERLWRVIFNDNKRLNRADYPG